MSAAKHMPQQFEHDGFNSPHEVEVVQSSAAKHAGNVTPLITTLRKIGEYRGEGPTHTTPWQDIVREMGHEAREALEAYAAEQPDPTDAVYALQVVIAAWERVYPTLPVSKALEDIEFREMQLARAAHAAATGGVPLDKRAHFWGDC